MIWKFKRRNVIKQMESSCDSIFEIEMQLTFQITIQNNSNKQTIKAVVSEGS